MIGIIGLGQTGISVARFLARQNISFWIADTREHPPCFNAFQKEFCKVACFTGELPEEEILSAEKIILSPGLNRDLPLLQKAIAQGIPIIGDIELFVREAKAPIIAITGTNAKGTVTTMLESILNAAKKEVLVGGNIGTPALDLLEKAPPDFYVLELSSFQLESTFSLHATAACILNISPDHLDHHKNLETYIQAKQQIYKNANAIIFNAEDAATFPPIKVEESSPPLSQKYFSFGLTPPSTTQAFGVVEQTLMYGNKKIIRAHELNVAGTHNWANALAASALATAVGIPLEAIADGLKNFRGLPHRCEFIGETNHVRWYNDSKGTNVGATRATLSGLGPTLEGKIILIAGGQGKGQDFSPLAPLCEHYVRTLILFGQDALQIQQALGKSVSQCLLVKNLEEAVITAKKIAQAQDVVLLSPICASLDMFKHYADRGEKFVALFHQHVNALPRPTFFLTACEPSGDLLGATLIDALKKENPNARFVGVAGPKMRAAGCEAWFAQEDLAVMGIVAVLKQLPRLLKIRHAVYNKVFELKPTAYIGIDAPDFNLSIEEKLKSQGIQTVHVNSPTLWAWRPGRIHKIKRAVDLMLTLFPFEPFVYEKEDIAAEYIGHPLADLLPLETQKNSAREQLGIPLDAKVLALMPGSRQNELKHLASLFIEVAAQCKKAMPALILYAPMINLAREAQFHQALQAMHPDGLPTIKTSVGNAHLILQAADAVLIASGTATLEALLCKTPMVVAYKTEAFSAWILRKLIKIPHVSLPNILANKKIIGEFLQENATIENLTQACMTLLTQDNSALIEHFDSIHRTLRHNAAQQAAQAIMKLTQKNIRA